MRRREVLVGAAAATTLAGGLTVAVTDFDMTGADTDDTTPKQLETIEAPGSESGKVTVPASDQVMVVEFFASWCSVCAEQVPNTAQVYEEYSDRAQFVSVTIEPVGHMTTREDIADWWGDHGGQWTVAIDDSLSRELGAVEVPYTFVIDESNTVVWSASGYKAPDELREPIQHALDA